MLTQRVPRQVFYYDHNVYGLKLTSILFPGITHFTNSEQAQQRWAISHHVRLGLITTLLDHLGLIRKEDVSKETYPHRVKKDNVFFNDITEYIKNCKNPFTQQEEGSDGGHLFNICSGKAASKETTNFLLNVRENGNSARDKFIASCIKDPASFEKPITKQKIFTFASESIKNKRNMADGKVHEVKMQRDLIGRILGIALENKVDIKQVLEYPLTPVPLSLCHMDGLMNKTPKATLFKKLESCVTGSSPAPSSVDAYTLTIRSLETRGCFSRI